MIAKLLCKFFGHKRGKRYDMPPGSDMNGYRCPRCEATWTRPRKKTS